MTGDHKIASYGMNCFYSMIDGLIQQRIDAYKEGYQPNPDDGVDLLDLFMQSTQDRYKLSGMVFSFLNAGRECLLMFRGKNNAAGDTTSFSCAWMIAEMHHTKNRHLHAVEKMREELENMGFSSGYLGYADTPVSG